MANEEKFVKAIGEYRKQLAKGEIRVAYKGLMGYLEGLRLHFSKKYPDFYVSSSVQFGCMDYSYFYFIPKKLKQLGLKIVILFAHDSFNFEVWLAGYNKGVQTKYWKLLKEGNYNKHPLPSSIKGVDYITNYTLVENADFSDLDALRRQIEEGISGFIVDVENFLVKKS